MPTSYHTQPGLFTGCSLFFPPQLHSNTLVGSFQRHQVLSIESLLQVLSTESFPLAESPLPICSDSSLDMGKLWYIHTLNYFTTVKMNQRLPHFSTWMYQNIMGSKRSRCSSQSRFHHPPGAWILPEAWPWLGAGTAMP